MAHVLIIDDDQMLCEMVSRKMHNLGHQTVSAHTLSQGLSTVSDAAFDLILLDVRLPDGSGLEALTQLKRAKSQPEIIIITGEGDPDGAELAIETGAWDYIEKPLSMREIALQVTRALQYRQEKTAAKPAMLLKRAKIIGSDAKFEGCLEKVAQASGADMPVLITGATGSGKELFARAVHANSNRSNGSFVVLDCAAFPENLVESIIFGHRKGAFTSADRNRDGLILEAHKGTLFMDEVGELSPSVQKAFLRVLQEHRFRPVGGKRELTSNFRLVAATNRNLEEMVGKGQFRQDLLFRLKAVSIHLPSLVERQSDIEPLALHYISVSCKRYDMGIKGLSPEFTDALLAYTWPGNVRELVHAMDFAVSNARKHDVLFPTHLPDNIRISIKRKAIRSSVSNPAPGAPLASPDTMLPSLKTAIENTERQYFESLMKFTDGDIQTACRISGLSRSGLYARIKKYNIPRPV